MCCVARVSQSIGKTTETTQIYLYIEDAFLNLTQVESLFQQHNGQKVNQLRKPCEVLDQVGPKPKPKDLARCYWECVKCDTVAQEDAKCLVVPPSCGQGPRPAPRLDHDSTTWGR